MRVHWLHHAEVDGPGSIPGILQRLGHQARGTRLYAGEPLPAPADFDALIVLGGPMNIYEHELHPWLVPEKALIRKALDSGKQLLGICLGAQLIADALGGPVRRNPERERGWLPVERSVEARHSGLLSGLPDRFTVFQWHEDSYTLPAGARCLAHSAACPQQAFDYDGGRVAGVQFHPEITLANAQQWFDGELWPESAYVQSPAAIFAERQAFEDSEQLMATLLQSFLRA